MIINIKISKLISTFWAAINQHSWLHIRYWSKISAYCTATKQIPAQFNVQPVASWHHNVAKIPNNIDNGDKIEARSQQNVFGLEVCG